MPAVPAPLPVDDEARVARLRGLDVLDSPAEQVYDDLALLASQICRTPIALVSLVDGRRQWFKARVGLLATETHRDLAFCSHALLTPEAPFTVTDALRDERFSDNPLVTGEPGIRFYAGAPIVLRTGEAMGTVCVIDTQPRTLSADEVHCLQALARQAAVLLDLRERTRAAEASRRALAAEAQRRRELMQHVSDAVVFHRADFGVAEASDSFARMLGYSEAEVLSLMPWQWDARLDTRAKVVAEARRHGDGPASFETVWRRKDGTELDVEIVRSPIRSDSGQETLFVCRDVTERNRTHRALRQTSDLLAQMGKMAGVGGWELDLASMAIKWTDEVYRIHEVDRDTELELSRSIDFYSPEARPVVRAAVQAAIDHGTPWDHELAFVTAKGRRRWVRAQGEAVRHDGKTLRLFGAFQDITERKRADQALVDSEQRLRMIADNLPALVSYIDREQRYRFVNAHVGRIFDTAPASMLGRTMREVRGEALYAALAPRVEAALRGETVSFQDSAEIRGRVYHYQSDYIPDRGADGEVRGFYALTFDITDLKEAERRLDKLARVDALTGLANRRQFDEALGLAMGRTRRSKVPMALMFLDIDRFKAINDALGHAGGDSVLREFAARLQASVRSTDLVARLAGDEFVILLEGLVDVAQLERFAEKILVALRPAIRVQGTAVEATASIGLARYDGGPSTPEELLARADAGLYASKEKGRDRFCVA